MKKPIILLVALCITAIAIVSFTHKKEASGEFRSLSMYEYESELREARLKNLQIDTLTVEQFIKEYEITFDLINKATKKGEVNELRLQSGANTKFTNYHFRSMETEASQLLNGSNYKGYNKGIVYKVKHSDSEKLYFTFITTIFNEENEPIDVFDLVEYYHCFVLTVK
jgi:hypothetical protein